MAVRRRVRHHVNPLNHGFWTITHDFLPPAQYDVELGCADALFLFQLAEKHPHGHYVGLEIRQEMVDRVNRKAKKLKLPHLRAIYAHLNVDLPSLFRPAQIQRAYINFPDPWFKKAQHKRRVTTPELVKTLVELVADDGEIFFQSDIFDLALDAMAVFEQEPGLRNKHGAWSFAKVNPYDAKSLREVRVEEKGLPVWRMMYIKT